MKKYFFEPELEIIELMNAGIFMDNVEDSSAFGGSEEGEQGGVEE